MARNGSGTMTVPNSFVAGTTITASAHNQNDLDLAAEITNSLALDGQSTMTGQFKSASGTAALPGMAFSADLDSGLFRIGSNNVGVACGGLKIVDVSTTGLVVTGDTSVSGALTVIGAIGGPGSVPLGALIPYLGSTAPTNFLFPFGQIISRATYATLFALIGTTFGAGDGVTSFGLPDLRDRTIFGLGNMGGPDRGLITVAGGNFNGTVLGATGGAENHTLTTAELPAHSHGIAEPNGGQGHAHGFGSNNRIVSDLTAGHDGEIAAGVGRGFRNTAANAPMAFAASGITINNAGGGTAHPIIPPAMMLPYILRVI